MEFGATTQAHEENEPKQLMKDWMTGAVAMGPAGNFQDGH